MSTTPTGMPIIECDTCHQRHPDGRNHCWYCLRPSLFIDPHNRCRTCWKEQP